MKTKKPFRVMLAACCATLLAAPWASHAQFHDRDTRKAYSAWTIEQIQAQPEVKANIPVHFTVPEAGYVTLVIDDSEGRRVCNLLNDTWLEAGEHTRYWDGYDVGEILCRYSKNFDTLRDRVAPGEYTVRGLIHGDVKLKYLGAVQSPGTPPWHTPDNSGGWLADHTPPTDVLFLPNGSPFGSDPQLFISASGGEAGHGAMWVDETGRKRYGGREGAVGSTLDPGPNARKDVYGYAFSNRNLYFLRKVDVEKNGHLALDRVLGIKTKKTEGDWVVERPKFDIAAYNGVILLGRPNENAIDIYDANEKFANNMRKGRIEVKDGRGMTFDARGNLYMLVGQTLQRFHPNLSDLENPKLGSGRVVVRGLEDPRRVLLAEDGNFYISDWGESHQVKVFNRSGHLLKAIGKPGGQQFGLYDEEQMCQPSGMAIDSKGRLWVAEHNYAPKRISQWDARTGRFAQGFYGPPKYGGGGHWDPKDMSRFYYSSNTQGIEFEVDFEKRTSKPRGIYYLNGYDAVRRQPLEKGMMFQRCPDVSIYRDGVHYMINSFVGDAYFINSKANIFIMDDEACIARPVVFIGFPGHSPEKSRFAAYMDADPKLAEYVREVIYAPLEKGDSRKNRVVIWSDLNLDAVPQVEEIQYRIFKEVRNAKRDFQSITFNDDLTIITGGGMKVPAPTFNENGVPVYDFAAAETVPMSRYLTDVALGDDGHFIFTMDDYAHQRAMYGWKGQELMWQINGVRTATAAFKGQLINQQRNLGFPFTAPGAPDCEMIALNGYRGNVPLVTTDGLYVTDLGADARTTPVMAVPEEKRGMIIDNVSWGEEHFCPAIDQLEDGRIIYTAGGRAENIAFEVLNLDSLKRLPPQTFHVSGAALADKPERYLQPGEDRKIERTMNVAMLEGSDAIKIDGKANDWAEAQWIDIDERTQTTGALAVQDGSLYAAWKTNQPDLLNNNIADGVEYAFATGGGLDLMIRTNLSLEKPKRHKHYERNIANVAAGDLRIFITRLRDPKAGPVKAVRFEPAGTGTGHLYESPIGTAKFASVEEISESVKLGQSDGFYEVAIPLSVIGIEPKEGEATIGDMGVLIGNGAETAARLYWSNRSATMVSDIPTEARLLPYAWGTLIFGDGPAKARNADRN